MGSSSCLNRRSVPSKAVPDTRRGALVFGVCGGVPCPPVIQSRHLALPKLTFVSFLVLPSPPQSNTVLLVAAFCEVFPLLLVKRLVVGENNAAVSSTRLLLICVCDFCTTLISALCTLSSLHVSVDMRIASLALPPNLSHQSFQGYGWISCLRL